MKSIFTLSIALFSTICFAQYNYEVSDRYPYGKPHPEAPEQIKDFESLIGSCNCKSTSRNPDGTWAESEDIIWKWKYIMNGMAVQDETLKPDGSHSGSIRQYIADSSRWYVHYYSSKLPSTILPAWEGNKFDDKIILYKDQKAPNGMEGMYRITFYDITESGYKWIGEWVDLEEKIIYPTWKIECVRTIEPSSDLDRIYENSRAFSQALIDADYIRLVNFYTSDAKIFPDKKEIIAGKDGLTKYWTLPSDVKIPYHKVTPSEIYIENDLAYDYGIYEGKTLTKDKKEVSWKGKYVIIWKKINNDWKIYLDIWNSISN